MVFSSILFLLYFLPFFLAIYFICPKKFKNLFLLLSSILFYSWGAPKFIFVILGTTLIDFYLVKLLEKSASNRHRKMMLTFSVSLNLSLLVYFKYSNFFVENFNFVLSLLGFEEVTWVKLILPIGISFYTFESITYVVDVYRRVHKPLSNFWDYQLYIILFPKLIAGPIIRYHDLADQIQNRDANDTVNDKLIGFYRFVIGLAKKVLIANQVGGIADKIFAMNYLELDCYMAWIGSLAYTFQIYFDFSGYSDMAIGLARMIGFKFPENFNNPYVSTSVTEFWRRWHISLGAWMKNYLYIPLGGNKVGTKSKLYFNLWVVFLVSGFWHGASWNFIIWGAYHGLFLVFERAFLLTIYSKIGKINALVFTFFVVNIGWVFFRIEELPYALNYLKRMFLFDNGINFRLDSEFYFYFALAIIFSFLTFIPFGKKIQEWYFFANDNYKILNTQSNGKYICMSIISLLLFFLCLSSISTLNFNPFIYFRF